MGQVLERNVSDRAIEAFKKRTELNGTSLEQELRELIEAHVPLTPEERVAVSLAILAKTKGPVPSFTLDEIREGLL